MNDSKNLIHTMTRFSLSSVMKLKILYPIRAKADLNLDSDLKSHILDSLTIDINNGLQKNLYFKIKQLH